MGAAVFAEPDGPKTKPAEIERSLSRTLLALLLSLLLHGMVGGLGLAGSLIHPQPLDLPGDGGPGGPLGDGEMEGGGDGGDGGGDPPEAEAAPPAKPIQVSVYTPPPATMPGRATTEEPEQADPETRQNDTQPTRRKTPRKPASGNPGSGSGSPGNGSGTGGGNSDGDGTADGDDKNSGVPGNKAPGKRRRCEQLDEVTRLADNRWQVERKIVDYYASHLRQLERQAGTRTHWGPEGKPDGVKVFLPRCSVLKQVGVRNGDIIHTVNGRKVSSVTQAVSTYLALRKESQLHVKLTRKDGRKLTFHYRIKG